jgi:heme A synthase
MTKQRTLTRVFAGLLAAGTMAAGAVAPADAAGVQDDKPTQSGPLDTGWNGT